MLDPIHGLIVTLAILMALCSMPKVKRDKESFDFFCRYKEELETFHYPNDNVMREQVLNVPDGWAEMVAEAINESPQMVKIYVQSLWENGWPVVKIQNRLIELAAKNGKKLFFITKLEPHERS